MHIVNVNVNYSWSWINRSLFTRFVHLFKKLKLIFKYKLPIITEIFKWSILNDPLTMIEKSLTTTSLKYTQIQSVKIDRTERWKEIEEEGEIETDRG